MLLLSIVHVLILHLLLLHVLHTLLLHVRIDMRSNQLCVAQPRHVSFEPAWAILEHELAAQIHISMQQYFAKLKEMEPDNAFRPDTLVPFCIVFAHNCFVPRGYG